MTFLADMILLMEKQKFTPIAGWGKASSQLEDWAVLCTVFLGDEGTHRAMYKIFLLLEEMSGPARVKGHRPVSNPPSTPPSYT